MTIIIEFKTKRQARRALNRIAENKKLVFTEKENCAYDNTITATIMTDMEYHNSIQENQYNQREENEEVNSYFLEITSNVLTRDKLEEIAEKTAARSGEIVE